MYRRLLLCTDGSDRAQQAARDGLKLAAALHASTVALLVSPPFEPPAGYETTPLAEQILRHERSSKLAASRALDAITRRAKVLGVTCKALHIGRYPPAETIVDTALKERCDLIVLGSHGHGALSQLLLGSVTTRVAATCTVPVLIVRTPVAATRRSRSPRLGT
ncbi:MAG: universal stress protein [Rhodanobacteraceae bacterium]|nr:universal stress protein [Rhodanobacteraceae bacterium]